MENAFQINLFIEVFSLSFYAFATILVSSTFFCWLRCPPARSRGAGGRGTVTICLWGCWSTRWIFLSTFFDFTSLIDFEVRVHWVYPRIFEGSGSSFLVTRLLYCLGRIGSSHLGSCLHLCSWKESSIYGSNLLELKTISR